MAESPALQSMFAPKSIVIVGASPESTNTRHLIEGLRNVGYSGSVTGVNPNRDSVLGVDCVPRVADLDHSPDLAVVLLAYARVEAALNELADKGCRSAYVLAVGGSEDRHEALRRVMAERGMQLLGPNCNGFINVVGRVHGWCGPLRRPYMPGALAIVGQSGAVLNSALHSVWDRGLGLSYVVSTGDEVSVSAADVLTFLSESADTRAVVLYLENLHNFHALSAGIRACRSKDIPVIALAPVSSDAARKVALTHTGAVTPGPTITSAALEALGVIRASTVDEALDSASLFVQLPRKVWRPIERVGVVSVSGGWAAILAELLSSEGLALPDLPPEITEVLPAAVAPTNPLDLTAIRAYAERYPSIVEAFVKHDGFDAVVVQTGAWEGSEQWFAPVWAWASRADKPVFLAGNEIIALGDETRKILQRNPLPVVQGAERVSRALSALRTHMRAEIEPPRIEGSVRAAWSGPSIATLRDLTGIFAEYGLSVPDSSVIESTAGGDPPFLPAVLKIESAALPHKTEVGAVRPSLRDSTAFEDALKELREISRDLDIDDAQIVAQRHVEGGLELLLGAVTAPNVGAVLTLGLGGVWAEVLNRTAAALCPVSSDQAIQLIERIGVAPILAGYRGSPALAQDLLVEAIVGLSRLAHDYRGQLLELDINPVIVGPNDCWVVDALARFGDGE